MDSINQLKQSIEVAKQRPLGQAHANPFRVGQVTNVNGIYEIPPTVTLGEGDLAMQARLGMNIWDINPYDTVIWITTENGVPVIISRLPGVGSATLLPEDEEDEPDPWQPLPFNTGWANYHDSSWGEARFRKQSDGWVSLQGLVERVSGVSTVIGTLPEGYRPEQVHNFTGLSAGTMCMIEVSPVGNIRLDPGYGGDASTYVSLSDIMFPTAFNPAAVIYPTAEGQWAGQEGIGSESPWAFLRSDGWVWWNGILKNVSNPNTAPFTLMRTDGRVTSAPTAHVIGVVLNSGNAGRLDFGGNSDILQRGCGRVISRNANQLLQHIVLGGTNYFGTVGSHQPWELLPLESGFIFYGKDHTFPQYFRDAHGRVHLQGKLDASTKTGTLITTLPVGYRPGQKLMFHTLQNETQHGRVDIHTDGSVIATSDPTQWITLAGINFDAEA